MLCNHSIASDYYWFAVMSHRRVSDEEIRDWASYFVRASGRNTIHLPAEDSTTDDPAPLCDVELKSDERIWLSKPISIYPKGYAKVCSNCMETLEQSLGKDPFLEGGEDQSQVR